MKHTNITIEKIINGGFGLSHLDSGQVLLSRFVLPGEEVIVTTARKKKNLLFGEPSRIVSAHPKRRQAPCKYFARCGGCDLQHCNYSTQLSIKQTIIEELFARQNIKLHDEISAILPSPEKLGYRQRIRLQVGEDRRIGFNRMESHDLVEIQQCLLAKNEINKVLAALRQSEDFFELLRVTEEMELSWNPVADEVICLLTLKRKPRPKDFQRSQECIETIPHLEQVFFRGSDFPLTNSNSSTDWSHYSIVYSPVDESESKFTLSWEAGSFCQVNLAQNKNMIETVVQFCSPEATEEILDLYCGMGNFSIPLARKCRTVTGYEGQGAAIRSARHNAEHTSCTNTTFTKASIEKVCMKLVKNNALYDTTVIDPPRLGIPGLAPALGKITRNKLVYISCDPATLVRDLGQLTNEGFRVDRIQPFDMFPQTHHIETVVLLTKQ